MTDTALTSAQRIEELRQLFLSAPAAASTRILAVVLSLLLIAIVLSLVRRRLLREEHTPIWLVLGVGLVVLGLWEGPLDWLTRAIGAWTTSSTLFFFGQLFLVALCLNYAVRLSRLSLQMKNLCQDVALLRARFESEPVPEGEPAGSRAAP